MNTFTAQLLPNLPKSVHEYTHQIEPVRSNSITHLEEEGVIVPSKKKDT